jgi:small subunit ribosomal protein S18
MEEEIRVDAQVLKSISPMELRYTDVDKLAMFVSGIGKILARKYTGLTAQQQRHVTRMIKRARNMLLMK